jgi:LuxR family maltose regulon positive regulatory protein
VIPLDAERRWYRYHHLFADQLRARLRATQPAWAAEVLRRASTWFAESGFLVEAIEHALESGDGAFAAGQLEPYSMTVLGWGETERVGRWFARLPAEAWPGHPRLCLNRTWQLFLSNRYDTLPHWLQTAEAGLSDQPPDVADALRGEALTLRAFLASDDPEQALDLAQQAAVLAPPDNALVRGLIHMAQAVSYRELGEPEQAIAAFEAAIPWHWTAGNFVAALMAAADVVLLARVVGQLGRAEALCRQWLARAHESGMERLPAAGLVHQPLAAILTERGQYEAAADHLRQAELVRVAGPGDSFLGLAAARLAAVAGDDATMTACLDPFLKQAGSPAGLPLALVTWVVLVLLDAGRFDDAGALLAATRPSGGDPLRPLENQAMAARHRAQTALMQGSTPALRTAMQQLTACLEHANRRAWRGLAIALLATRAVCAFGLRDSTQARADLTQALAWAEPDGWVQVFCGLRAPMAALLDQALREGWVQGAFVSAVRAAFTRGAVAAGLAPDLPEPLSAREIEVLRLMTEGLTYAAIARRLHLSLNTVRYHVKGLYGKLAVSSRADAIARGRALKIV